MVTEYVPNALEEAAAAGDAAEQMARHAQNERIGRIESRLGVPAGFYLNLKDQGSDWEFAIKVVVLVEAALGAVVAAKLQNEAMRDHCDRLNLAGRTGKIELAGSLGVLAPDEMKALGTLAEIRNRFAHKVANIASNLEAFAASLPAAELSKLCRGAMMVPAGLEHDVDFLWSSPQAPSIFRYLLWTSGSMLLDALAAQDAHAEAEAERRRLLEQAAQTARSGLPFSLKDLF